MAKPKLALIPASQGDKLYSVLPSGGVGDFDFTRNSSATRINKDGLIETVGSGVSRLNYPMIDGVVSGCPSHILEPQRSNSFSYSQDFSNSYWTKSGSSISSDLTISPDGTLNADKLIENSDTVEHFLRRSIAVPIGFYTWSVFVKASDRKYIVLRTNADGGAYKNACFDVELGIVVYDGLHNSEANIEAFPNGWYRISALSKETSGTTRNYQIHISNSPIVNNSGISYNGDGTSGIYLYGVQLELGHKSSYIPTTTAAVTRSAETATGSGDAATFNDSEGVLMAEISELTEDSGLSRRITISDGSTNNRVSIELDETEGLIKLFFSGNGTLNQLTKNISDVYTPFKILASYELNSLKLYINGYKLTEDTSIVLPNGLNDLSFDSGTGGSNFYGNTKQIQYYDTALSDTDLETLTSWVSFQEMAEGQLYTIE